MICSDDVGFVLSFYAGVDRSCLGSRLHISTNPGRFECSSQILDDDMLVAPKP